MSGAFVAGEVGSGVAASGVCPSGPSLAFGDSLLAAAVELEAVTTAVALESAGVAVGSEDGVDASVGFGLGPLRLLLKYADYDAAGFGSDTRKLWLQAEWSL